MAAKDISGSQQAIPAPEKALPPTRTSALATALPPCGRNIVLVATREAASEKWGLEVDSWMRLVSFRQGSPTSQAVLRLRDSSHPLSHYVGQTVTMPSRQGLVLKAVDGTPVATMAQLRTVMSEGGNEIELLFSMEVV